MLWHWPIPQSPNYKFFNTPRNNPENIKVYTWDLCFSWIAASSGYVVRFSIMLITIRMIYSRAKSKGLIFLTDVALYVEFNASDMFFILNRMPKSFHPKASSIFSKKLSDSSIIPSRHYLGMLVIRTHTCLVAAFWSCSPVPFPHTL